MLTHDERSALHDFRQWLLQRFEARLHATLLFGSRARAEGNEDSDVDVLVLIDGSSAPENHEVACFSGELLTRYDVIVSPLVMSTERFQELRERERAIVTEIDRDGIPL